MPTIVFEMERLRNPYSGLGQYCLQLGQALAAQPVPPFHFTYLVPPAFAGTFSENVTYQIVHKLQRFWPVRTTAALWHCAHQDSIYWPNNKHIRSTMTIHDLNFLERTDYSAFKKRLHLHALQRRVNRCQGLVYISTFVKDWTQAHLQIPVTTLEQVIYNGNNLADTGAATSRSAWSGWGNFLFSIGIHPKKNYHVLLPLLRAFPQYNWVIAGADSRGYQQQLAQRAIELGVADRLIFTGPVTEAEKRWLFTQSTALLFPSLSEGFGLPVVEAMSVGKPVFLSERTSLPEIGGQEAYYFTNFNTDHISAVFQSGMADFEADPHKSQKLKARAHAFRWTEAARRYVQFYQTVLQTHTTSRL